MAEDTIITADDAQIALATELRQVWDEADQYRKGEERVWTRNLNWYGGLHWQESDKELSDDTIVTTYPAGDTELSKYVVNRTQNAIIVGAEIQAENGPETRILPRELNEPPDYRLTEKGAAKLRGIEGLPISDEQLLGTEDVPEEVIIAAVEEGALIPEDDFVAITDTLAAEETQLRYDILWERGDFDYQLLESILNKGVIGHQASIVQWNDDTNEIEWFNVHPFNVWIAPDATGTNDSEYVIYDQIISREEALDRFPQHAAAIEEHKGQWQDERGDQSGGGGYIRLPYGGTNFNRKMIRLRTYWRRHQLLDMPMSPDDALESGDVAQGLADVGGEVQESLVLPDGTSTSPAADNWPTEQRRGIQQVQMIGTTVLDVRECPYRDIPVMWNVNIPVPHRPYGQGEPERVADVQEQLNRAFTVVSNILSFYQAPIILMPQSVKNRLGDNTDVFARPDRVFILPDEMVLALGGDNVVRVIDPPALPGDTIQFMRLLIEMHNELSGNVDVLQGQAKSEWSGKVVEQLQSAARGPLGLKARGTERSLKYGAKNIMLGIIFDFLPESEWMAMSSKYPIQIARAIRERGRNLQYDVSVEVMGGKGTTRQVEQQKFMNLRQLGDVDRLTLLKKLDIPNAQEINQRVQQEQMAAAMAQAAQQTDTEGGSPPSQGESPDQG